MSTQEETCLRPGISRANAWAFSLGTSIGWGSLVVTANTYLAQAGPAGSVLGLVIGALIMLVISKNYAYMMNCYPNAGGAYGFCRDAFSYDHGFLAAWFLALTYLAILWANATSLPLFSRYFLGDLFRFGRMYEIFGYDIYLGEAILPMAFVIATGLLCGRSPRAAGRLMTGMVILFSAGILICFGGAVFRVNRGFTPAYVPDRSAVQQILKIAVISPWAFIGFENISHFSEEFSFPHSRIYRLLVISVVTTTLLYVCVILLSVTAYPEGYGSWLEYIRDLDHLSGMEALPAFYAADHYLGSAGTTILMISLLALILTSLIGNMTALSRLFYALGREGILPASVGRLNRHGAPGKAFVLIAAVSLVIPFVGRTAIGWIVDVTTIGATLIYGFVSAAAWKTARFRNDAAEKATGLAGLVLMIAFGVYLLAPNLFSRGSMETESYFLFVVWAMLGFAVFRLILRRDGKRRFGKSIIVWIALLSLILFVSLVWMNQSIMDVTDSAISSIGKVTMGGGSPAVIREKIEMVHLVSGRSIVVVVMVFMLSLAILMNNYRVMSRQAESNLLELQTVRDKAEKDSLTGTKSKHAYTETEREINEKIGQGKMEDFAMAVLDVNGLKYVNDTQGHQAGDELILKASRMICMYFANSPVFRTGGDEFAVLVQGSDFENRASILEMFKAGSESHIATNDVVISVGCTDYRKGQDQALEDLFRRADERMYENKKYLKDRGAVTRL